jgi:ABC-type antimicrobial peptide transport system permease subunit
VRTAAGLTLGTAGAILAERGIRSQLYGVEGMDPWTFGVAIAVLATAAAAAAFLPARRAAAVNPATALRGE